MNRKRLPIGIEDFKELIKYHYYYVDKTDFIADTFEDKVALYTRPRRFGKTLNMSMLKYFYSIKEKPENEDEDLFKGLNIEKNPETIEHKNRYPVISLSFKEIYADHYHDAIDQLAELIGKLVGSFPELFDSDKLDQFEKDKLTLYREEKATPRQLTQSLNNLSEYLAKHYGQNVVVLIDEYDVLLEKSRDSSYYNEMVTFMRSFLSSVLKTNQYLMKGILTGCLCISQESIFTGLNNISVYTVIDEKAEKAFGFTQDEINRMYETYGMAYKLPEVKEWYDGYLFGRVEIYNPWSALKYLYEHLINPYKDPVSYWANSSGNDLIIRYFQQANKQMRKDIRDLMDGKTIQKPVFLNLSYREIENDDNVYTLMLLTGYLKAVRKVEEDTWELTIPNLEVKKIFRNQFMNYFKQIQKNTAPLILETFKQKDEQKAQEQINWLLDRHISFMDTGEDFYHGFLTGALTGMEGWNLVSNREAGDGRFDIRMTSKDRKYAIVIECKKSGSSEDMKKDAKKGVEQIRSKRYLNNAETSGYSNRIGYGISFYGKSCWVEKGEA